jgi:signal transduction histidine kinase
MIDQIQILGKEVCGWYDAPLFLFSGNVFSNLIYYSHIFPALAAILLGVLVYSSNRKMLINKLLFFTMCIFALWSTFDLVLWASERVDLIMFLWSGLAYLEPLIYLGCFYLVWYFTKRKDIPLKGKIGLLLLMVPIIILAPTAYNLSGFDFTNCEREAIEGPLWYYIYSFEFLIILLIAYIGGKAVRKAADRKVSKQNALMTIGTVLFLITLSLGNITGSFSLDWSVAQYGLFGMPIFIAALAYLIIRYQRFNTKVFATQILTGSFAILVLSLLLVEDLGLIHIIVVFTFVLSIVFGYLLNVSVTKEYKQRKEIEELAHNLEQSNSQLATANEKLKSLDKLKTEFLSLASHQLRSPLTAIKGYASMLTEGSFGKLIDQKQDEAVRRIYASAQGLTNIVEDLLNVSKIEQGGMKYEMMPTDVTGIVTQLYNEMSIPATNKGLAFTLEIAPNEKFEATIDPLKMKQVFLNLTDNSIKYTEKGFVKLILKHEGNNLVFAVSDSGAGISPETKAKLFEKFSRGEGGKMNTGGSGLGLYLAREITRAHKGDIVIESEGLGKGSTFKVVIPNS